MEREAVVCKRACCESLPSWSGKVLERRFWEEVVEVPGNESESWCDMCVCLLLFHLFPL